MGRGGYFRKESSFRFFFRVFSYDVFIRDLVFVIFVIFVFVDGC